MPRRSYGNGNDNSSSNDNGNGSASEEGHITKDSNEAILFFDNIFPLKLSSLLVRPWKSDSDVSDLLRQFETSSLGILDPIRLVKTAIPENLPITVTEILPRLKDGGAYVKFKYNARTTDPAEIEAQLLKRLKEKPIKPWFSIFRPVNARLVQGTPWLEDLYRYPTSFVKIEFVPPTPGTTPEELPEETLYTLFRKYGKIADIIPQPTDSKITPRYAHIQFPVTRDAITARNCMHGFIVNEMLGGGKNGTKLRMSFEKRVKAHSVWNWLSNHPRVVIPVVAALIAGFSVLIFDPIREFFIKLHIQHSLEFKDSRIYKWFKKQSADLGLSGKSKGDSLEEVWNHRRDAIDKVQGWLDETSDTFIVITGPKGSGKVEMVMDQALEGRKNVLKVDCRRIVEARGEAGTIKHLAMAVGYRPVFSWANSMSSMIDLAVQSTTGVKAGFSETLESQLNKITQTTTGALKDVAVGSRSKRDSDYRLSEDAWLEAHPERRPVVVIDNFLHKGEENSIVYDKLAEWAATVVQNNIAHVIFLTTDTAYSKPLDKALPDRLFRTVSLGDLAPEVAKNFVLSRLKDQIAAEEKVRQEAGDEKTKEVLVPRPNMLELDHCIDTLGGRLTDLEFLARRLRLGQSPRQAMDEIVSETATDIARIYLLGKPSEIADKKFSSQQAWYLVKSLATNPKLRYNEVILSAPFSSAAPAAASNADAAIESLVSADLIAIETHQGRPMAIKAGKPLHQAAFSVLLQDRVLRAKMDYDVLNDSSKAEARSIDKVENELALLGTLPRQTGETAGRINFLLRKLEDSQAKIAKWDKEMTTLKKLLSMEF
ncbi:hypothetical protein FGRMN_10400 [Fusarium graminum]|nr:hypothetical protein FGRMN_10400 [Fusarium graminum]